MSDSNLNHLETTLLEVVRSLKTEGLEIIERLVASGANINCKEENGRTPLQLALARQEKEVAKSTSFVRTSGNLSEKITRTLVTLNAEIRPGDLARAVQCVDTTTLALMLDHGGNPNDRLLPYSNDKPINPERHPTALMCAAGKPNGNFELLLRAGADDSAGFWDWERTDEEHGTELVAKDSAKGITEDYWFKRVDTNLGDLLDNKAAALQELLISPDKKYTKTDVELYLKIIQGRRNLFRLLKETRDLLAPQIMPNGLAFQVVLNVLRYPGLRELSSNLMQNIQCYPLAAKSQPAQTPRDTCIP